MKAGVGQEAGTGAASPLSRAPDKTTQNRLATQAKHTQILVHCIFLHAQREGRVVTFRPHHLHRLSFHTTQFITTSLTSLFAGISD